jgi:hypothetical protein
VSSKFNQSPLHKGDRFIERNGAVGWANRWLGFGPYPEFTQHLFSLAFRQTMQQLPEREIKTVARSERMLFPSSPMPVTPRISLAVADSLIQTPSARPSGDAQMKNLW